MPQLILLDSSHQYEHTLRELDLWVPRMEPGSIMLLHDTSTYARTWTQRARAASNARSTIGCRAHPEAAFVSLNRR